MSKNMGNNITFIDGMPYAVCLPDGGQKEWADRSEFARLLKGAGETDMHTHMASWCSNRFVGTLFDEEAGCFWDAAGMVTQHDGSKENWGVDRSDYRGYGTGFRPLLVPLDPETFRPDLDRFGKVPDGTVVQLGTLYMGGKALRNPEDPVASPQPKLISGFYPGDVPVYEKGAALHIAHTSNDVGEQIRFVVVGGKLISDRVLLGCVSHDDLEREFHLSKDVTRVQVTEQKVETPQKEDEKVSLWMRLGVSIDVTREELEALQHEQDYDSARETLVKLLCSGKCRIDGNAYFPELDEDELEIPWDFDLPDMKFKAEPAIREQTLEETIENAEHMKQMNVRSLDETRVKSAEDKER